MLDKFIVPIKFVLILIKKVLNIGKVCVAGTFIASNFIESVEVTRVTKDSYDFLYSREKF